MLAETADDVMVGSGCWVTVRDSGCCWNGIGRRPWKARAPGRQRCRPGAGSTAREQRTSRGVTAGWSGERL